MTYSSQEVILLKNKSEIRSPQQKLGSLTKEDRFLERFLERSP